MPGREGRLCTCSVRDTFQVGGRSVAVFRFGGPPHTPPSLFCEVRKSVPERESCSVDIETCLRPPLLTPTALKDPTAGEGYGTTPSTFKKYLPFCVTRHSRSITTPFVTVVGVGLHATSWLRPCPLCPLLWVMHCCVVWGTCLGCRRSARGTPKMIC